MEDVKPTGSSATQPAAHHSAIEGLTLQPRPTVADLHGENHFAKVARKHWLKDKASSVRPEVVKQELWDKLEEIGFAYPSLIILENLQLLERYLWPGYTDDASNYHHLLLVLLVNVKKRENLQSWGEFTMGMLRSLC
jgi:intron-binding protein aquarius